MICSIRPVGFYILTGHFFKFSVCEKFRKPGFLILAGVNKIP